MSEMGPLLEGIGLKKTYRQGSQRLEVLKGVNLRIREAEITVIVGPSGAGKSTLLHLLGGLDTPTSGEVRFQGRDLYAIPQREQAFIRNRAFGFVFQFYYLVGELTALENVILPGWIGNGGVSRETVRRAKELLDQVGLSQRATWLPSELSGGEQQRVAIARALMNQPKLVFCDEPTGNLDSETGEKILQLLVRLNREKATTFLIVTHEPAITQLAGRVLSLRDGQLWPHPLIS